jgi:hypothetical protein
MNRLTFELAMFRPSSSQLPPRAFPICQKRSGISLPWTAPITLRKHSLYFFLTCCRHAATLSGHKSQTVYSLEPFALPTAWPDSYRAYHHPSAPPNHDATTFDSTYQQAYFGTYDQSIYHQHGGLNAPLDFTISPELLGTTGYLQEPFANYDYNAVYPEFHTTQNIDPLGLGAPPGFQPDWMNTGISNDEYAGQVSAPVPDQLQLVGQLPQAAVAPQPSGQALTFGQAPQATVAPQPFGQALMCPRGCEGTFGRRGEYRRHMKKHERHAFQCNQIGCYKSFYRKDKLNDHLRQAHGIVAPGSRRRG